MKPPEPPETHDASDELTVDEASLLVDELKREGFTTTETEPFAALADLRDRKLLMQGGPQAFSGRHSKGGLYNDHNDYFGKDRELPE